MFILVCDMFEISLGRTLKESVILHYVLVISLNFTFYATASTKWDLSGDVLILTHD